MPENGHIRGHIHDDDLELYDAGHLEHEFIDALELHLSHCQDCRERLDQCSGPQTSLSKSEGKVK